MKIISKFLFCIPINSSIVSPNDFGDLFAPISEESQLFKLENFFLKDFQAKVSSLCVSLSIEQLFDFVDGISITFYKHRVTTRNAINIMKLHYKSFILLTMVHNGEVNLHWKEHVFQSALSTAASLDPNAITYLPASLQSIIGAKSKNQNHAINKSSKVNRKVVTTLESEILDPIWRFRLWVLLSMCSSPYSGLQSLPCTNSDCHDAFLSAACDTLKDAIMSRTTNLTSFIVCSEIRQLHHMLGIQMRLTDQVRIPTSYVLVYTYLHSIYLV